MPTYFCEHCGTKIEEEDMVEALNVSNAFMFLCPCCDEWILLEKEVKIDKNLYQLP